MKKIYAAVALMMTATATWAQNPGNATLNPANKSVLQLAAADYASTAYTVDAKPMAAAAATGDESKIISEQPEGTLYADMYRNCKGYDNGYEKSFSAYAGDIVISKDNKKLYIKNICATLNSGWIVGDIKDNGIVEFNFPQVVYHQDQDATGQDYELTLYAYKADVDNVNYKITADKTSQTINFRWQDNTLTQVNPNDVIAFLNSAGQFSGYGSYDNEFSVVTDPIAKPASSLTKSTYVMTYTDYLTQKTATKRVQVAIDGNDVYLGGFYNNCWIKGTKSNGKVSFPTLQYLGTETIINKVHEYMVAFEINEDRTKVTMIENLEFDYDEATGSMTTKNQSFGVNQGKEVAGLLDVYELPALKDAGYVVGKPRTPQIIQVMPYGAVGNFGAVAYYVSNLSADGKEMNEDNIFYNLYLDGKLYTFNKSDYQYMSYESLTDIPYAFYEVDYSQSSGGKGYDFIYNNGQQMIYIYKKFSGLGLKAVYVDGDTRIESEMATYGTIDGIDGISADDNANAVYYDLSGRKVATPEKGVYIKAIQKDGQTKTVKVMK